ncbi:hypothetical protein LBMAG42_21750 [Deltaproteobacteria bacterium]|nr:hypothetical protein LBMAG42_21750 [Deltaproteobacteria bacterium]
MIHRSLVLLPVALLLGCPETKEEETGVDPVDTADSGSGDTAETGDTAANEATVTITSPATETQSYDTVTMEWTVENFTLDEAGIGAANEEGHGHAHVYLDNEDQGATAGSSYTFTGLSAGAHTLEVRLAYNDHNYLETEASVDSVSVSILKPQIAISSPSDGYNTDSAGVYLTYSATDFAVVNNVDAAPVVGEGHVHLMLDGVYYGISTSPTGDWFLHLDGGPHTLGAMLVNNDHTDLSSGSPLAEVQVIVPDHAADIDIAAAIGTDFDSALVPFEVAVSNLDLSNNVGGAHVEGEGHYHIYVDGVYINYSASLLDYLHHVSGGTHTLQVVLADNDHTELGARDAIDFSVTADRPDVTISSPSDGESVSTSFNLSLSAENFAFSEDVGGAAVEDEGHYHVFVDGIYWTLGTGSSVVVEGVAPGEHVVSVELVSSDHSSLSPMVMDEITLTAI